MWDNVKYLSNLKTSMSILKQVDLKVDTACRPGRKDFFAYTYNVESRKKLFVLMLMKLSIVKKPK